MEECSGKEDPRTSEKDPDTDTSQAIGDVHQGISKTLEWGASTGSGSFTYLKDKSEVRCNLCMRNLNLQGVPQNQHIDIMAAHKATKGHKERKRQILEDEENKRLEDIYKELVQSKVRDILGCVEDHPKFLNHQWIPLGSFLKVWKMAFR